MIIEFAISTALRKKRRHLKHGWCGGFHKNRMRSVEPRILTILWLLVYGLLINERETRERVVGSIVDSRFSDYSVNRHYSPGIRLPLLVREPETRTLLSPTVLLYYVVEQRVQYVRN